MIVRPFITAGSFHPARNAPLRGAQNPPPGAQLGPNGGGSAESRTCRWVPNAKVDATNTVPRTASLEPATSIETQRR